MSTQTFHWERPLLALALEALESRVSEHNLHQSDTAALEAAYRHCEDITRSHSRTFYLASSLLSEEKRRAVWALYAFCRVSDDLVDRANQDPATDLESWRAQIHAERLIDQDPVILAWSDTRTRFQIPWLYSEQLINGVAKDLQQTRYQTFNDLARYCYGVACTVGLMSMHIVGFYGQEAIPYAIRLGVALQLTNILRDVGEDWQAGRLYLPADELEAFHLGEADIDRGVVDERWRAFMSAQIDRARELYAQALPGIALLDPDGRFAIGAAAELYQAILEEIEANDYNVFTRRAATGKWGKVRRLPGIWWRVRSLRYQPPTQNNIFI